MSSGTSSRETTSTGRRSRSAGSGAQGPAAAADREHGDEAVRYVLAQASPEALVWFASRAVSYLDESGFPDAVAPWFPDEDEPAA